jgi:V/A-type H+-transporting ATPase subunit E
MDAQLQELIDKIKAEGVKTAEAEAERIRKEAQRRADQIVAEAHKSAADIVAKGQAEADRFDHTAQEAVKQAARNTILSLRSQVIAMFRALTEGQAEKVLTGKVLEEAVVTLIKGWSSKGSAELQVLLPPAELKKVETALHGSLAEEIKRGVEIKPFPALKAGFRVGMKDGSAYFDFTSEEIASVLGEYLNPRLAELVEEAAKKEN